MAISKAIKKILNDLPVSPGVYKMLDKEGKVIYIGKAKDLSKRVKQYFQKNYEHSTRTKKLVENIIDIKFTGVDTELEAMMLETNLIKQFLPKYNIIMKDGKNYVYIKITKEDFPRIQIVRNILKDGAKYIGPKSSAHKVKETFKVLKKIFPFRHCSLDIKEVPGKKVKLNNKVIKYPCLDFFIKRCAAPCIAHCSKEEYQEIINNVEDFLNGKADEVLKSLKEEMMEHAKNKKFEKAAKTRDKIEKVKNILEKQKISDPKRKDTDIVNYCVTRNRAYFNLFQVRDGKLIGQENFVLSAEEIEEAKLSPEILEAFLKQYYGIATDIPKEILIPHKVDNKKEIEEMMATGLKHKPKIIIPKKGDKNKLLGMSLNNARIYADRNKPSWQEENELTINAAKELQKVLNLDKELKRIECYDISHLSGTDTVGSMVVFEKGAPKKSMYRKFKIRTVDGKADDYKSMEEVMYRRFSKITEQMQHVEYSFKKARKKNHKFIEKNSKVKLEKSDKTFYILEKDKKVAGFIATTEHSKKVAELTNLWLKKSERGTKLGYKLIKNAIKKTKAKRVYILCKTELKEYYQLIGFEEIKKIPEELRGKKRPKNITPLAFDKIKYKDDESFTKIPDLVIVDGGKGQLSAATKIFKQLDLKLPYISLAKRLEEIFHPKSKRSIILPKTSEALKLLQRARDEAHRFAISYNRNLRSKKFKKR